MTTDPRLEHLRMAFAGADDVAAVEGVIGKVRDLMKKAANDGDDALWESAIAFITVVERKGGRLLAAGMSDCLCGQAIFGCHGR